MCSGASVGVSGGLAGVIGGGPWLLVGAGTVNASLHAAQRARRPTIERLTANRAPQLGHEIVAVFDLVEAMDVQIPAVGLVVLREAASGGDIRQYN
jgi:hypothetical protein